MVISIQQAQYLGEYKISLNFSDGTQKIIDFEHFLRNANNPMTSKYLDKKLFSSFKVEYGDINWNDFEMCLPIRDLYEGKL
jgi:hypothetical protein